MQLRYNQPQPTNFSHDYSDRLPTTLCTTMHRNLSFMLIFQLMITVCHCQPTTLNVAGEDPSKAVKDLVIRLIGEARSALFNVTVIGKPNSNSNPYDTVSLQKRNGIIHISGSTAVAVSYGFHFYLKNFCDCHISWDYDQITLPNQLPDVNMSIISYDKFRYYQNVCTFSYSYAWWTWERWEREIDWMALNGVNIALAFTAQEAIWLRVYKKLNLTVDEINEHFGGPAFLAWSRMGNIRGWKGPLSEQWHDTSITLQHKILNRMLNLGIIPILPAFCGHVPRAFKRIFPKTRMTKLTKWVTFSDKYCCPYILDPHESLFETIGRLFLQEVRTEFGLYHYYNCDPFNEMKPPNASEAYLGKISTTIFHSMLAEDPSAMWILQGWTFGNDPSFWNVDVVQNFLNGVPDDRMIVLDLQSETRPQYVRLRSYFGKSFIWCMLHNFGGTLGMHGSFDIVNSRAIEARNMLNGTMIGTGLTPEGINQNYVVYDFMLETSWRNSSVDTHEWIEKYSIRRYGAQHTNLKKGWIALKDSVYNYKLFYPLHGSYTLCLRPNLKHIPWTWYNVSDVLTAWDLFVDIENVTIWKSPNYKFDLVDVTRQVLQIIFDQLYVTLKKAYYGKDVNEFIRISFNMTDLLSDLEMLLSTHERFMLGRWLNDAKSRASSPDEELILEFNARNQITLWGPNGESVDYATKQWSGVVADYYIPRWRLFFQYLYQCLTKAMRFDQKFFNKLIFAVIERPFSYSRKKYPTEPMDKPIRIVRRLHRKWRYNIFT